MKIKSIELEGFKRFTDLKIEEIPETAKLVVMIGPNGCGKSSVFDALLWCRGKKSGLGTFSAGSYYIKFGLSENSFTEPVLDFHNGEPETQEDWKKSVHVRTAYRNDLVIGRDAFSPRTRSIKEENRFFRLIENDEAVSSNYSHILDQWLEQTSDQERVSDNLGDLQEEIFGELRKVIEELFTDPELILANLGSPLKQMVFQFNKGSSHGFSYQNLSSGEKAALDLILDIIVAKTEFDDTVFCIDEPEAHIHTKLQGPLLEQLYKLIPDNSQLWIATHSIGMVRKARDLFYSNKDKGEPNTVVFLDFGKDDTGQDRNFDEEVTITPAKPNPNFWAQTYDVALGDLAKLVAPKRIILCEGKFEWATEGFDAACYNKIFGSRYPDTRFISIGGREDIKYADTRLIPVIEAIVEGAEILRLRDRDRATCQDRKDNAEKGILILKRKYIEKYLLDDEVLTQLCIDQQKSDNIQEFLDAKNKEIEKVMNNDKIHDKRRPIVQRVQEQAEKILELSYSGDSVNSFMRDILAPLIKPDMDVYKELHKDIFGSD